MTDDLLPDPQLRLLEAQLLAQPPQVSIAKQDELLYACAFAAGQQIARRSLRRWRMSTIVMGGMVVGMAIPHFGGSSQMARHPSEQSVPMVPAPSQQPAPPESMVSMQKPTTAVLDAWQVSDPVDQSLSDQLAQLERTRPQMKSLTVGTLIRAELHP